MQSRINDSVSDGVVYYFVALVWLGRARPDAVVERVGEGWRRQAGRLARYA